MSTQLSRALTRLTISFGALVVLAALGQPIPRAPLAAASSSDVLHVTRQLTPTPGVIHKGNDELALTPACEIDSCAADEVSDAAAEALARSALRMRWLLTSPSASSRACAVPGCTG